MKSVPTASSWLAFAFGLAALVSPAAAVPVRVLAWDSAVAEMRLALADAKGSTAIEAMHPSKRTGPYQLTAGEAPLVVQALDKKNPEGKPYTSEIKLPEGLKQPLLVILPDEKAPTGVRLHILDDDPSNFAWGTTRFINVTGRQLVFVYEKKLVALPASWTPVLASPGGETRNMEVKFFFRDEPAKPFYFSVWEQNSDLRMLVFLVPGEDPRLGPVAMKMIPEDRRLIKAAQTAAGKTGSAEP